MKMHLDVITPTSVLLSDDIDQITLNTASGEITILPNHIPLITKIVPGEMTVKIGEKISSYAITGGFLEMSSNKISILADYAVRASDIEITKAKQAKEQAEKLMKDKKGSQEFIIAEAELQKALLELKVANKRRQA